MTKWFPFSDFSHVTWNCHLFIFQRLGFHDVHVILDVLVVLVVMGVSIDVDMFTKIMLAN